MPSRCSTSSCQPCCSRGSEVFNNGRGLHCSAFALCSDIDEPFQGDATCGWSLCSLCIRVAPVSGNHSSMIRAPHCTQLAAALADTCLSTRTPDQVTMAQLPRNVYLLRHHSSLRLLKTKRVSLQLLWIGCILRRVLLQKAFRLGHSSKRFGQ